MGATHEALPAKQAVVDAEAGAGLSASRLRQRSRAAAGDRRTVIVAAAAECGWTVAAREAESDAAGADVNE